jgi:hypothetical protein
MTKPQPYPIYSLRAGKVTNLEAWLIPKDAFVSITNGHLRHGVLEKRKGYNFFGQLVHEQKT